MCVCVSEREREREICCYGAVDGVETRDELDGQGIESRLEGDSPCVPARPRYLPGLLYGGSFPGVKRPERGGDHSS